MQEHLYLFNLCVGTKVYFMNVYTLIICLKIFYTSRPNKTGMLLEIIKLF